jgi:hypothetical protein
MRTFILMTFLLSSLLLALGQDAPAPAYGLSGDHASDDAMVLPAMVSGDSESALFPAEGERSNYLNAGLSFGTAYDDNTLGTATNPVGDLSFTVAPFVSIEQTRARLRWQADYAPGFTFYRRLSDRNQDDQNLSAGFEYRLTEHMTMRLKDAFLKSSNFLGGLAQTQQSPFGVLQQSNSTLITPVTNRVSNTGSAEVTYQFGPNSVVGARGISNELLFPDSVQTAGLADSHSQSAEGFLTHRLARIHWVGVTYHFQRILTDMNEARNSSHAVLATYTIDFTPTMSLSVFAGPQYSGSSSQLAPASAKWLPAVGMTYNWQTTRSAFTVGAAHRISDGGGLQGAVQLTSFESSFRYEWARRWTLRLGGSYGRNELIQTIGLPLQDLASLIGLVSVSHQIGEHLSVEAGYVRAHQRALGASVVSSYDRNRPQITISYSFSRPLGR